MSPSEQFETQILLESVFMPEARRQRNKLYQDGKNPSARFIHYTSAESALNIIKSKCLWMRNANCMSDFREIQHGYEIFLDYFSDNSRKNQFYNALGTISSNIADKALSLFDQWWEIIRSSTYIASRIPSFELTCL